tara:strand:+ start:2151 stop:3614 length:1464 start_codon:yes stop_codon:yes gene_type:complete
MEVALDLVDLLKSANIENYNPDIDRITNLNKSLIENNNDSYDDRLLLSIAALVINLDESEIELGFNKSIILKLISNIESVITSQINEIIHHQDFKEIESIWLSLQDILNSVPNNSNVILDLLDVTKDELLEDFECNLVDMTGSSLFNKTYTSEYDQYGGKPYGAIIGLYDFNFNPQDEFIIRSMANLANANHSPFISQVGPQFFGCNDIEELSSIKDLSGILDHPKYSTWNEFRDTQEAAYVGLTLPKYMLRVPHKTEFFQESVTSYEKENFVWGYSSILFAKNMIKSFINTGWCQYIRGPKGGGMISGLPVYSFDFLGHDEVKIPVEFAIPDYKEYELAKCGFMPLVYQKGTGNACFFSCQSVKRAGKFVDKFDSQNSEMVTNLSYTLSITRVAHYIKRMMRDNIGANADAAYIEKSLNEWIMKYVTEINNPDEVSLKLYPFKQAEVTVKKTQHEIGWYDCEIKVLPHIQFEGMEVMLRLETRLSA